MDNVHNYSSSIHMPSSQTYRSVVIQVSEEAFALWKILIQTRFFSYYRIALIQRGLLVEIVDLFS
jgi:hypothetical protein